MEKQCYHSTVDERNAIHRCLNQGGSTQQVAGDHLSAVTLRIVDQPSEAGSLIRVSFFGNASAMYDFSSVVSSGYLGLDLVGIAGQQRAR